MNHVVFDTFAIMAYILDEPAAPIVEEYLERIATDGGPTGWMSAVNLGEVYYMSFHKVSSSAAERILEDVREMGIYISEPDVDFCIRAAKLKATYKMSYADAYAAALAIDMDADLLTGDSEFDALEKDQKLRIIKLPKR